MKIRYLSIVVFAAMALLSACSHDNAQEKQNAMIMQSNQIANEARAQAAQAVSDSKAAASAAERAAKAAQEASDKADRIFRESQKK